MRGARMHTATLDTKRAQEEHHVTMEAKGEVHDHRATVVLNKVETLMVLGCAPYERECSHAALRKRLALAEKHY